MEKIMKEISENIKKRDNNIKKKWYKVGKYILRGNKVKKHNEWKLAAKRTYIYYSKGKGDWEGPSPRELEKMREYKFKELLKGRKEKNAGNLLTAENNNPNHVTQEITTPQVQ